MCTNVYMPSGYNSIVAAVLLAQKKKKSFPEKSTGICPGSNIPESIAASKARFFVKEVDEGGSMGIGDCDGDDVADEAAATFFFAEFRRFRNAWLIFSRPTSSEACTHPPSGRGFRKRQPAAFSCLRISLATVVFWDFSAICPAWSELPGCSVSLASSASPRSSNSERDTQTAKCSRLSSWFWVSCPRSGSRQSFSTNWFRTVRLAVRQSSHLLQPSSGDIFRFTTR